MNNFTKKGIVHKIIITLVFLIMFNFIYPYIPTYAASILTEISEMPEVQEAAAEGQVMGDVGGVLFEPLFSLITTLGEGIIYILQLQLLGIPATVHIDTANEGTWTTVGGVLGGLAGGAAAVGLRTSYFFKSYRIRNRRVSTWSRCRSSCWRYYSR